MNSPFGLAVDSSKWGGDLTRLEAEALLAAGIVEYMAACGPGGYGQETQRQLDDAVAVGLHPSAYVFYEWADDNGRPNDPVAWINAAYDSLGPFAHQLVRFAVDIEDTGHPVPANWRSVVDALFKRADELFPFLADRWGGIANYMPGWYAKGHLGINLGDNCSTWNGKRRALHNSYYDGDPDIDGVPFGDYTQDDVALEQFQDTTYVGGQSVDVNMIYIPAPEEDDMTLDEKREMAELKQDLANARQIVDALVAVTVGNGTVPNFPADPLERLFAIAGPPTDMNLLLYADALNTALIQVKQHVGMA